MIYTRDSVVRLLHAACAVVAILAPASAAICIGAPLRFSATQPTQQWWCGESWVSRETRSPSDEAHLQKDRPQQLVPMSRQRSLRSWIWQIKVF